MIERFNNTREKIYNKIYISYEHKLIYTPILKYVYKDIVNIQIY